MGTPIAKDATTEVIGELDAGSSSQIGPSCSTDKQLKDDTAFVERVSRSGGFDQIENRRSTIPLHVATNVRVCVGDVLLDYPGWRVTPSGYLKTLERSLRIEKFVIASLDGFKTKTQ